jgi:hypothetical protein
VFGAERGETKRGVKTAPGTNIGEMRDSEGDCDYGGSDNEAYFGVPIEGVNLSRCDDGLRRLLKCRDPYKTVGDGLLANRRPSSWP